MPRLISAAVFACALALATTAAEARSYHHHRHQTRCDGFHGCRCGVTAARRHGLPLNYKGHNLKMARTWRDTFQEISAPIVGAVVYFRRGGPTGHVATIERPIDRKFAIVSDDKGTYRRDISKAVILAVN